MSAEIRTPFGTGYRVLPVHHSVTRFTLQKLLESGWTTTAHADDLEAAERHASAIGGQVRALNRKGDVVANWECE